MEQSLARGVGLYFESKTSPPLPPRSGFVQHCAQASLRKSAPPLSSTFGALHNAAMHVAILTFEGFNELDSLVALGVLNRIKKPGWRVTLSCPAPSVTSMNGLIVHAQSTLAEACAADAVIIGSGIKTREIANNPELMARLRLDPAR